TAGKQRHRYCRTKLPRLRRAGEEVRKSNALKAGESSQRDLRIERGLGLADVGIGGDELLLGGAEVRAALEQRRRPTRRDFRPHGLRDQGGAALDATGVAAEQNAQ